jgi:uncharacterized protein (DUF1778 family)
MHLDDHIRQVHEQLAAAAALGDERTQQVAEALVNAAVPAVRLALINALSAAADEVTAALLDAPGSPTVAVRLDGDDVRVDVSFDTTEPAAPPADEKDASARISLRLSESLKSEIERAAAQEGVSVNTWLVRAAGNALRGSWGGWPPHADRPGPGGRAGHGRGHNAHRVTGWIEG